MKNFWIRLVTEALFSIKNVSTLGGGLFLAYLLDQGFFDNMIPGLASDIIPGTAAYAAALAVYALSVFMSISSEPFKQNVIQKMKEKELKTLNSSIGRLANESKKRLGNAYVLRLKKVLIDKNDILDSYYKNSDNPIKERIVEKALNLIFNYIKLMNNYCIRSKDLESVDVGKVTERININTRKLNFTSDAIALEDLKKIIEIDAQFIKQLKEERFELNRISTRLEYMETTVNMFKRQVLSNIESEEMLESIQTAVNEAEALDQVLTERRRIKKNM